MRITEVTIRIAFARPNPKIRAYATFVVSHTLVISHIRIIQQESGRLLMQMPSVKVKGISTDPDSPVFLDKDGNPFHYRDVAFPVNNEARQRIERIVLGCYCQAERDGLDTVVYDITESGRILERDVSHIAGRAS